MKYYFYSAAQYYNPPNMAIVSCVSTHHPFQEIKTMNEGSNYKYSLINFREITKKEYELFKELFTFSTTGS